MEPIASADTIDVTNPETDSDQDASYALVAKEFGAPLARLAAAYEMHREQQKDLLQDIHLALWRSLGAFKQQCSLRTWVYRVAHNVASTHVLKQRRWRTSRWMSIEELEHVPAEHDQMGELDNAAVLAKLLQLIHRLKPIDRDVILLYLEGVEAGEIGDIVGLTSSNVAQKIHRIKKLLNQRFHAGDTHDKR